MGIAYRCDAALHCTFVVWDGSVTPEDWTTHLEALLADSNFPPGKLMLGDLRTAGDVDSFGHDVMSAIATRGAAAPEQLSGLRVAVLADGAWEKARQFLDEEVIVPGLNGTLFTELTTACAWLGVDRNDAEPILSELRATLRTAR